MAEVRFEDVMVHFSTDEFQKLEKWQQELYFDVLVENYKSLIVTGNPVTRSEVVAWFERGERQNVMECQESRSGDSSAGENEKEFGSESESWDLPNGVKTGEGLGQIFSEPNTAMLEPAKMPDSWYEDDMAVGRPPERLCVPLMQRPVRDKWVQPPGKATYGSASPTRSQASAVALKPYACQECGETFRLKGLLRIHHRVSLRKPTLPCPKCGICVPSSWHLKNHQRIHSRPHAGRGGVDCLRTGPGSQAEAGLHRCAFCRKTCRRYLDFLQHQKTHEEAKTWPCAQCDVTFMSQSDLAMHEETHIDEALGMCAPCGENCVCALSFLLHVERSTENRRTDSQEYEKLHRDVNSQPEKPYACHQCGEQFRLEGNLQKHYRYCPKVWLQKYRYGITPPKYQKDRDKRASDSIVPKASRDSSGPPSQTSPARWTCSHCSRRFRSSYSLGKHRQRHKAEPCRSSVELDKSPSPAKSLGGHAAIGVMKKQLKCNECGERFVFKGQLAKHVKAHAKASCGGSLSYGGRFSKHLQGRSGEGPSSGGRQKDFSTPTVAVERTQQEEDRSQCPECGKSIAKSHFRRHQEWHQGVRYRCRLCGRVSGYHSGTYHHIRKHIEKGEVPACRKCVKRNQSKSCRCLIEKIYLEPKPLVSSS